VQVTRIAKLMVTQLGFSKLGQVAWSQSSGNTFLGGSAGQPTDFSMAIADQIDNEVKQLVERAYRRAKDLLTTNVEVLHSIAALLIEKENVDGEEFQQIILASQAQQYLKNDAPGVTIPYQSA
jgi:cell division protease FtsH